MYRRKNCIVGPQCVKYNVQLEILCSFLYKHRAHIGISLSLNFYLLLYVLHQLHAGSLSLRIFATSSHSTCECHLLCARYWLGNWRRKDKSQLLVPRRHSQAAGEGGADS